MSKQVYISADYDKNKGDRVVVNELNKWGKDNLHKVDFIDMSKVSSGSVSNSGDCRICDLKGEFNRQINASSATIFIVGNETAGRDAGNKCERIYTDFFNCFCTPYKQNGNGVQRCKYPNTYPVTETDDCGIINQFSYLRHEFEQSKKKGKTIIILYNSTRNESDWLPQYMNGYENYAKPFWKIDADSNKVGDYSYIKEVLGF